VDELQDETNPFDISFRPRTVQQGREFDEFMSQELGLQRLPTGGSISEKRQRLQDALESETIYNFMVKLVAETGYESAFVR
jgi:hypothetical protein